MPFDNWRLNSLETRLHQALMQNCSGYLTDPFYQANQPLLLCIVVTSLLRQPFLLRITSVRSGLSSGGDANIVNGEPLTASEEYFCARQSLPNGSMPLTIFYRAWWRVMSVSALIKRQQQRIPRCFLGAAGCMMGSDQNSSLLFESLGVGLCLIVHLGLRCLLSLGNEGLSMILGNVHIY